MSSAAATRIRESFGPAPLDVAIVLGTGLGEIIGDDPRDVVIPYAELPGFPRTAVSGHAGRLVLSQRGALRVAWLQGREHYYEHGNARAMDGALATLAALGLRALVVTSASGSTRDDLPPGTPVRLTDHIAFGGPNPLIGTPGDTRFVPMIEAYDATLAARLDAAARRAGITLRSGVYMWFSGPSFETPAEVRMAALLGADLVGMSTVPEVILARSHGLRVAGLSLVTNFGSGLAGGAPDHAETKRVAAQGATQMKILIDHFLELTSEP